MQIITYTYAHRHKAYMNTFAHLYMNLCIYLYMHKFVQTLYIYVYKK